MNRAERYWPLLVWALLFTLGSVIKWLAFGSENIMLDVPQDACLWATGMLLAEVLAERDRAGAILLPRFHQYTGGGQVGYDVRYDIGLTGDPRPSLRTLISAIATMVIWILCLMVTQSIMAEPPRIDRSIGIVLIYIFGLISVTLALWTTLGSNPPSTGEVTTR